MMHKYTLIFLLSLHFAYAQTTTKHPDMVFVKGGSFPMGCKSESIDCEEMNYRNALPVHTVTVDDFYIGKYEVTNEQYAKFLNEYGGQGLVKEGDDYQGEIMVKTNQWGVFLDGDTWKAQPGYEKYPIVHVTWYGANAYCKFYGGRLPTEAEWEFAAHGGNQSKGYQFAGENELKKVGWYEDNSAEKTHQVGQLQGNELGIHDMSGNVWEWCNDWYDIKYYKDSPSDNPQGVSEGKAKVLRGGSWDYGTQSCSTFFRLSDKPDFEYDDNGFRIVILP